MASSRAAQARGANTMKPRPNAVWVVEKWDDQSRAWFATSCIEDDRGVGLVRLNKLRGMYFLAKFRLVQYVAKGGKG